MDPAAPGGEAFLAPVGGRRLNVAHLGQVRAAWWHGSALQSIRLRSGRRAGAGGRGPTPYPAADAAMPEHSVADDLADRCLPPAFRRCRLRACRPASRRAALARAEVPMSVARFRSRLVLELGLATAALVSS